MFRLPAIASLLTLALAPAAMAGQGDPQTLDQIDSQTYQLFSSTAGDSVLVEPGPGDTFVFHTNFTITLAAVAGKQPPNCTLTDNNTDATCPAAGITWIAAIGNGGADTITMQAPGPGEPNARLFVDGDGDDGVAGPDTITGGTAADWLTGDAGVDTIHGGAGDDEINGGDGADHLFGEAGQDEILGGYNSDTGGDEIRGGSENDELDGANGVDTISGDGGGDAILGGAGNDNLFGDAGNDTVTGGPGSDAINGGTDSDTVRYDESGRLAGVVVDLASTAAPDGDPMENAFDFENAVGTAHDDTIRGTDSANTLTGLAGDDTLEGRDGPDMMGGNAGADAMSGGGGNDQLYGGDDGDTFDGGAGNDLEAGEAGDDVFLASAGSDALLGGTERDTADYSARTAGLTITLDGSGGKTDGDATDDDGAGPVAAADGVTDVEVLLGGSGDDTFVGGDAAEVLRGGGGADTLTGAAGGDRFEGGAEADTYNAADGEADTLVCEGADVLNADAADAREGCSVPSGPTVTPEPTATPGPTATPTPGPTAEPPAMPAKVTARFRAGRHSARVRRFVVTGLPSGGKATLRCAGRRCPFKTTSGTNLLRAFRKRPLPVGTTLRLTLTAPGHRTLVLRFTVRPGKVTRSVIT